MCCPISVFTKSRQCPGLTCYSFELVFDRSLSNVYLKTDYPWISSVSAHRYRDIHGYRQYLHTNAGISVDIISFWTQMDIRGYHQYLDTDAGLSVDTVSICTQIQGYQWISSVSAHKCRDIRGYQYLDTDTGISVDIISIWTQMQGHPWVSSVSVHRYRDPFRVPSGLLLYGIYSEIQTEIEIHNFGI
jgi:hypothetical protein